MGQLNRITQQLDVMGGKACIRGMRVTVGMIVVWLKWNVNLHSNIPVQD